MKIYIAGPITGVENYRHPFDIMEARLAEQGCQVLTPIVFPEGLTSADYMRMCFAMIDVAECVLFLEGWENSAGAQLEHQYCAYIGKPMIHESEIE